MQEVGKPSQSLVNMIGELGENELVMELHSKNPNNRSAAVIGLAERLGPEDIFAFLLPLKETETNRFTREEIETALQKADKMMQNIQNLQQARVFEMRLNEIPFQKIKSGSKTIEIRLNDEKRQKMRVGDVILFTHAIKREQKIRAQVVGLHKFNTFLDLFQRFPMSKYGCEGANIDQLLRSTYNIYTEDQEAQYGVLGIEIRVLKPETCDKLVFPQMIERE